MKRQDFAERLVELIDSRQDVPYAWGANDCVTFAAACVIATTGVDPIAEIRGRWDSAASAVSMLAELGGLEAACDARFTRRSTPLLMQRGDIGLCLAGGRESLAVCVGVHCAAPGDDGMLFVPLTDIQIAWEVA